MCQKPELRLKLGPMKNEIQTGRNPDGYMLGQTYCPERQLKKKNARKEYIYITGAGKQ